MATKDFDFTDPWNFPPEVVRATGGHGGESWLLLGSEKTALYDCGMAYAADRTVANIRVALAACDEGGRARTLDYILLSHSHYDHVGALPQIRDAWPDAVVCGSAYCRRVFASEGARETMHTLGQAAADTMGEERVSDIRVDGLVIDRVVGEGDVLSLGEESILVMEGKGHTNCSLLFALEPQRYLFSNESTGVLDLHDPDHPTNETAILKSYEDALETLQKCRAYPATRIFSPHYGVAPEGFIEEYWDLFEREAVREHQLIVELFEEGKTEDEILERFAQEYWYPERAKEQPWEAFLVNARATIEVHRPKKRDAACAV